MKDNHNIEMEDIFEFPMERSADFSFWEAISHQELQENVLDKLDTDTVRRFCGIVRTGSPFQSGDYFYRIKSN
ncbi:MAG: hypothetical protein HOF21_07555 [Nitrospina sp.]|jgi:hypothetical protein|nr:hypothetical protein [Nitrospina sp.]MBT5633583.1 hypothetical protein [Nitrospina sp.]